LSSSSFGKLCPLSLLLIEHLETLDELLVEIESFDLLLHANTVVNLREPETLRWVLAINRLDAYRFADIEISLRVRGQIVSFLLLRVDQLDAFAGVEDVEV